MIRTLSPEDISITTGERLRIYTQGGVAVQDICEYFKAVENAYCSFYVLRDIVEQIKDQRDQKSFLPLSSLLKFLFRKTYSIFLTETHARLRL